MNQFTNRQSHEHEAIYGQYMVRGARRAQGGALADAVMHQPNLCRVPDFGEFVYIRYGNKNYKIATRSLVYFLLKGSAPPVFGPCSCKNKGCVAPDHQNLIKVEALQE